MPLDWQKLNQPTSTYVLCAISRNDCRLTKCDVGQVVSIDMLPDDILLDIFDLYVDKAPGEDEHPFKDLSTKKEIESWQSLVHVCRRWRCVVFGSPRRLKLRLVYTHKTTVRDTLDVWPALPLLIKGNVSYTSWADKFVAVLEHSELVEKIDLYGQDATLPFEKVFAAMQKSLPELTVLVLQLHFIFGTVSPVLLDSFLGGSAPRLRRLELKGILFPGLPRLLLSATRLVNLKLCNIPHSGYISPKEMVAALSALTSLVQLKLQFESRRSRPGRTRPPPPSTRSALPVLTSLSFSGVSEYLDDLVACIDAPRLDNLSITFFDQVVFNTPHLVQFISRIPTLKALKETHIFFEDTAAWVSSQSGYGMLSVKIPSNRGLDNHVMSLEMICTSCLPLSMSEDLYIYENIYWSRDWQDEFQDRLWLNLFRPFTAVKSLYVSEVIVPHVVPSLQELVGGGTTDVLPSLQNIFLEKLQRLERDQEVVGKFIAAHQLSGHPITVSLWEREFCFVDFYDQ